MPARFQAANPRVAEDTSFSRIFMTVSQQASQQQQMEAEEGSRGPSVHELFLAHQKEQISIEQLRELLGELHGLKFSDQATKLLLDPNLSFRKFQNLALRPFEPRPGDPFVASCRQGGGGGGGACSGPQRDSEQAACSPWGGRGGPGSAAGAKARPPLVDQLGFFSGAGVPVRYEDTASAIINDNSGLPAPPLPARSSRRVSDVNQDQELKVAGRVAKMKGGNPVMKTNRTSSGNTMLDRRESGEGEDFYAPQEMANTAIRLFLAGEIKQADFQQVLGKMGLDLDAPEHQEVKELIRRQAQVGDRSFSQFSRAIGHRVLAAAATKPPSPAGVDQEFPPARAAAGVRRISLEA